MASGRPPRIMKFSEMTSNQSARAPASISGKCFGRSPIPWPRCGQSANIEGKAGTPGRSPRAVPGAPACGRGPGGGRVSGRGPRSSADDLTALLLALGLGHRHDALALAGVLPGAAVAGAGTRAVSLALVDPGALHLVAPGLLLGARLDGTGGEKRRRRGGDQDALLRSSHGGSPS